jgi:hypothetical protein
MPLVPLRFASSRWGLLSLPVFHHFWSHEDGPSGYKVLNQLGLIDRGELVSITLTASGIHSDVLSAMGRLAFQSMTEK